MEHGNCRSGRQQLPTLARSARRCSCHNSLMTGALCSARLRNGEPCCSVATHDGFCAYHAALADELGADVVANGDQTKKRNARQRVPVIAESEPLELTPTAAKSPSAVRPALALDRCRRARDDPLRPARGRDQHDARDLGDMHLPGVWQGVPAGDLRSRPRSADQGDRDAAARGPRSRRRGRGCRAADAETAEEVKNPTNDELHLVVALSYATEIRAVVDHGDDALRSKVESWEPKARASLARVLAEVG